MKETQGIPPEIIAAISASIGIMLSDTNTKPKGQGGFAVRRNRNRRSWKEAGRLNNMINRLVW